MAIISSSYSGVEISPITAENTYEQEVSVGFPSAFGLGGWLFRRHFATGLDFRSSMQIKAVYCSYS